MDNTKSKKADETTEEVVETVETTEKTAETEIQAPVANISEKVEMKAPEATPKTTKDQTKSTNSAYEANKVYTFTRAVNVHTEPSLAALVIGVRSVTETVTPERILDLDGYIWAEYHSSPKHARYVALATSDGAEMFVK
jgi:hypothetical protein